LDKANTYVSAMLIFSTGGAARFTAVALLDFAELHSLFRIAKFSFFIRLIENLPRTNTSNFVYSFRKIIFYSNYRISQITV